MPALNYIGTHFAAPAVGKDTCALLIGTQEAGSTVDKCTINAAGADWGLKMPGNEGSVISGTAIYGGRERALDAVRGGNIHFSGCTFGPGLDREPTRSRFSLRKQCDIGLKGGIAGVTFDNCVMTDLLLGDFSIYDHEPGSAPTRNIILRGCQHPSGRDTPIIIRCLHAEPPVLIDTNAVVLRVPSLLVAAYFAWCRHFGDTRRPATP